MKTQLGIIIILIKGQQLAELQFIRGTKSKNVKMMKTRHFVYYISSLAIIFSGCVCQHPMEKETPMEKEFLRKELSGDLRQILVSEAEIQKLSNEGNCLMIYGLHINEKKYWRNLSVGTGKQLEDVLNYYGNSAFVWDSALIVAKKDMILRRPDWHERVSTNFNKVIITPAIYFGFFHSNK
ncbi:MAG: hypothetical protein WDM80_08645 [Limisphaerales bacterium]